MIDKILDNLYQITACICIILFTIAIFTKIIGNPIKSILNNFKDFIAFLAKEFKGEAGRAGKFNLVLICLILILCIILYTSNSVFNIFFSSGEKQPIVIFLLLLAFCFTLYISVRFVTDLYKTSNLLNLLKRSK